MFYIGLPVVAAVLFVLLRGALNDGARRRSDLQRAAQDSRFRQI